VALGDEATRRAIPEAIRAVSPNGSAAARVRSPRVRRSRSRGSFLSRSACVTHAGCGTRALVSASRPGRPRCRSSAQVRSWRQSCSLGISWCPWCP